MQAFPTGNYGPLAVTKKQGNDMTLSIRSTPLQAILPPPLVIDLDGTLLRSDLLLETGLVYFKTHPARLLQPLIWLMQGKATLKDRLARATQIDVTLLPYDSEVIQFIQSERAKGRRLVLATASHDTLAKRIADHLQLFDDVIASDGKHNLSAQRKRDALINNYGEHGFDYVGNSHDDLPVLDAARRAYLVNPEPGVERRSRNLGNVEMVFRTHRGVARNWMRALRLHQWMKNLLIFIPLLAAHQLNQIALLWEGLLAFFCYGLCTSSVYLLNDLLDLDDDRHHTIKRHRPFAAGNLSIKSGLITLTLLLACAFIGSAWLLPIKFVEVLVVYYVLTLSYSMLIKHWMVIDVILLGSLYTIRVIAGAAVFDIPLSFWLLAFSLFLFLSLALVKRCIELRHALDHGHKGKASGRGYYPDDLPILSALGAASGYMAVLVLALYIHDPSTMSLYSHPEIIWPACPLLLFWVSRVWMLTHRGLMDEDPVIFAIRDHASLVVGALLTVVFWAAL